jgi:hypothetical protein
VLYLPVLFFSFLELAISHLLLNSVSVFYTSCTKIYSCTLQLDTNITVGGAILLQADAGFINPEEEWSLDSLVQLSM